MFFGAGISANTVFTFPESAEEYAAVVVPSALVLKEEEIAAMHRYLAMGGKVFVSGPSCLAECGNEWHLPQKPILASPEDFFDTIAYGVWHKHAEWILKTEIEQSRETCEWRQVGEGIWYNPHRMADQPNGGDLVSLARQAVGKPPVEILSSKGYLITTFETADAHIVHFLAEDYDVDIDHQLDEMRFHRSRVNYVNKVEPIGIDPVVLLRSDAKPEIYLPFENAAAEVLTDGDGWRVTLPERTAYAIMKFSK